VDEAMTRYVALLRGINVGGKNLIGMPALKARFEAQGLTDVVTYIQSGNVVFTSTQSGSLLVKRIERDLSKAFGYDASVVLRSRQQMRRVVDAAPARFGEQPELYRYDVVFLKSPLSASEAIAVVPTRDGVDQAFAGSGVLYFSRLIEKASKSQLNRLIGMPIYKRMTIRNWNTTTRLREIMEAGARRRGMRVE
jgi:uncharacterized protein (DUF1697 family)